MHDIDHLIEPPGGRARLYSVDLLRGIAMILMALDHSRDYFHFCGFYSGFDPLDLSQTYSALFITRWVTHFCAPIFVFLAGTGAYLSASRGKSRSELSILLFTRGLWLIFLELTVVNVSWYFNFDFRVVMGGVIWAIGWSMIALSVLIILPLRAITAFGVAMIVLHDIFDGVQSQNLGSLGWLWTILHEWNAIQLTPQTIFVIAYPLIPWIGVMAAGYGFGKMLLLEPGKRRKWLLILGISLILIFIIIRATNLYGDPRPWSGQQSKIFTLFSFINTEKYPPSLLFLLMTLGPSITALALFDRNPGSFARSVIVFGRVPLFFYLLHIPFIHALAVLFAYLHYSRAQWLFQFPYIGPGVHNPSVPVGYGYGLPVVYLVWLAVIIILYPACSWYAGIKKRHRNAWLSYL